jgi:hypothetical protein
MPLIDVTYDGSLDEEVSRRLSELLPAVVSEAVECPEDPSTGPEQPGDIEIGFREKSPLGVGDWPTLTSSREVDLCTHLCTRQGGTRWDAGAAEGLKRLHAVGLRSTAKRPETVRDGGDARRMAHNPEAGGSNPPPATKARGPFSNRERAFCI